MRVSVGRDLLVLTWSSDSAGQDPYFAIAASGSRKDQVWYRNAAAFRAASSFNLTNGLVVRSGA